LKETTVSEDSIPATPRLREKLTRNRVIEAALRIMDDDGLEAVTMRRVAHELGVEAMSLYRYVGDKDELLDGICEQVMADFEFPSPTGQWAEDCREGARAWRRLMQRHPQVIELFARQRGPANSIESMRPSEYALRLFRASGLSDRDVAQAFHAFGGYIQGFVVMERGSIAGGTDAAHVKARQALADLDPDEFSALRAVAPYFADCSPDEQFEFGLDLLIQGLLAKVGRRRPRG
jgi:AcrR family transcriptional regulator